MMDTVPEPAGRASRRSMILGLISDTHGLVRPRVWQAFDGVDLILHAGDVGGSHVLDELALMAPVRAVSGNVDLDGSGRLASSIDLACGGLRVHVSHGHEMGHPTADRLLARYGADLVVFGHTHRPLVQFDGRRLAVNPGAAGPRRFHLEPSVARVRIDGGEAEVEIVPLGG